MAQLLLQCTVALLMPHCVSAAGQLLQASALLMHRHRTLTPSGSSTLQDGSATCHAPGYKC